MGMRLKIGEREEALGYKGGFRFEAAAETVGVPETDARFSGPLTVEGTLENLGGSFRVAGEICARRSFVCDRCLAQAEAAERYRFEEDFHRGEATDEEDGFTDDGIDLLPLVRDTILAALPIRNLCRPDCKGLCPKCGADLNQGDCGCDREAVDPRLEALKNWLQDE
ncbi:MAG: DUF177 domain-containing protein [Schwartzia sp.]|nr:DUF177 domain-containing protein [Schwartzia sp. (in: firmicutes)]